MQQNVVDEKSFIIDQLLKENATLRTQLYSLEFKVMVLTQENQKLEQLGEGNGKRNERNSSNVRDGQ